MVGDGEPDADLTANAPLLFFLFYMPPRLAATSSTRLFTSPVYYASRSFRSCPQILYTSGSTPTSEHSRTLEPSVDATPPAPSTSRSQWTKDISKPIPKQRLQRRKTEEAPAAKPSFTGLGLSMPIILTLKATFPNVREATEAQRRFIPAIVQGRQDVLLKGQTGSGKWVVSTFFSLRRWVMMLIVIQVFRNHARSNE